MCNSDNAVNPDDSGKPTSTRAETSAQMPVRRHPKRWRRRIARFISVFAGGAVLALLVFGWNVRYMPNKTVESGEVSELAWQLRVSTEWGYLSMGVAWPNLPEDVAPLVMQVGFDNTATHTADSFADESCVPISGQSTSVHRACIWYSPAPAEAVSVQIGERKTVPTHLITGFGYPHVTYWYYADIPDNWPTAEYGKRCEFLPDNSPAPAHGCKVEALNAKGEAIPFGKNY